MVKKSFSKISVIPTEFEPSTFRFASTIELYLGGENCEKYQELINP